VEDDTILEETVVVLETDGAVDAGRDDESETVELMESRGLETETDGDQKGLGCRSLITDCAYSS
jgi:hypothetical protein